ncbi:conserved hypothetical protein (plasmid) [Pseudarthrobacter chlorophenolicus A6]|uniref:Uncharacterized protein n=1 Tax=Pseudarthrobacter chlorophenolicus (strain ATCC 700700 / DSM 12829 / CIP 107037 / JCM 12360 / KCTC 9906 / NCIMB 13794 / A6) TaxID=452863 RepID=B8HI40_PSECP|nr:hypothetical protein [Pseudarthrobacter chlorophenolicus]ACL42087.1 conserved hypothetical protein [Pseudarthrobacter chlorophenolicus A6]SDQ13251.1 hypothetical protein SAMN04489738_0195 [Pseudarthrobacter chlorophenolicus]
MTNTPDELRAWAKGSLPLEAATELLLRGFSGRFVEPGWPWMKNDDGRPWIDFASIPEEIGGLSSGEQRFLMIAASLGGEDVRISLSDEMSMDRTLLELVLAAMAHAAGSHQDSAMVERPDGTIGFERKEALYPWPKQVQSFRLIDGGKG